MDLPCVSVRLAPVGESAVKEGSQECLKAYLSRQEETNQPALLGNWRVLLVKAAPLLEFRGLLCAQRCIRRESVQLGAGEERESREGRAGVAILLSPSFLQRHTGRVGSSAGARPLAPTGVLVRECWGCAPRQQHARLTCAKRRETAAPARCLLRRMAVCWPGPVVPIACRSQPSPRAVALPGEIC